MRELLLKLKIIDFLTLKLKIEKSTFIDRLISITKSENLDLLEDPFDASKLSNKNFRGTVNMDGFALKMKKSYVDSRINMASAKGIFTETEKQLKIDVEINGLNNYLKILYVLIVIYFCSLFYQLYLPKVDIFFLVFSLVSIIIIYIVSFLMMRKSVKILKNNLEKEFHFLVEN